MVVSKNEPKTLEVIRAELDDNDGAGGDRQRPSSIEIEGLKCNVSHFDGLLELLL